MHTTRGRYFSSACYTYQSFPSISIDKKSNAWGMAVLPRMASSECSPSQPTYSLKSVTLLPVWFACKAAKFSGGSFDEDSIPSFIVNQVPGVAQVLSIPSAEFDTPWIFHADNLLDFFQDAVLSGLGCHVSRMVDQPITFGTDPNRRMIFNARHWQRPLR